MRVMAFNEHWAKILALSHGVYLKRFSLNLKINSFSISLFAIVSNCFKISRKKNKLISCEKWDFCVILKHLFLNTSRFQLLRPFYCIASVLSFFFNHLHSLEPTFSPDLFSQSHFQTSQYWRLMSTTPFPEFCSCMQPVHTLLVQ